MVEKVSARACSCNRVTVIAASPGYHYLAVTKRHGTVYSVPVIGWSIRIEENGNADSVLPILLHPVTHSPDAAYAIRWPDGRVHVLGSDRYYRSVEEWVFDIRVLACGHELVGTA